MPTNTGGGTTTSFNNTPQAKDDLFGATEDGIFTFDVMANDLGGNAKVLWSIDDTNMTDDSGNGTYDLVAKDAALVPEFSDLGARIWIENGVVKYDSNPIDYLALGQQVVDKFTYAIRLGNGTLSWATVYVTLTGTNDAVSITSATATGAVVEDSAQTASTTDSNQASGSIAFTDQDLADTHTATAQADPTNTTSLGTFALGPVNEAANAANGTVGWTYTIDEAAAQYLAAGQVKTEKYIVTINDGHGSTVQQTITVTITGTNDQPDIRAAAGDTASASLNEKNAGLTTNGTLTVTDVDTTDTISTSVGLTTVTGPTNGLTNAQLQAMFTVTPASGLAANTGDANNLGWNFNSGGQAFNYLRAGQTLQLVYTLTVSDGNGGTDTEAVTLTITGTNDAPVLTDTSDPAAVVELGNASAQDLAAINGSFSVTDLDIGDTLDASVVGGAVVQLNGSPFALPAGASALTAAGAFTVTDTTSNGGAANIAYSYNPGAANLDFLAAGESLTITYTIVVNDGTANSATQDVTFTITGTNDNPTVSVADLSGAATEDAKRPDAQRHGHDYVRRPRPDRHALDERHGGRWQHAWRQLARLGDRPGDRRWRRHGDVELLGPQRQRAVPGAWPDGERDVHDPHLRQRRLYRPGGDGHSHRHE
jgi:VCBS repeat-containing protein